MKVLLDHHNPFFLAHGGVQLQIQNTKAALERAGVDVECVRWWDERQTGELIHFFGLPPQHYVNIVRHKGTKLVLTVLLGGLGARSGWKRFLQKHAIGAAWKLLPNRLISRVGWKIWTVADAYIALTPWEARLMVEVFRAPSDRVHVVPNGVEDFFLNRDPVPRGQWLVCTATIIPLKQVLKLAQAAVQAQTRLWFIGRPYDDADEYTRQFVEFVRQNPSWVKYEGPINDRQQLARIYREARGFVLLSWWESLSLSALEAAACGCPLLLSDQPWAHSVFANHATYCPAYASVSLLASRLRCFYDQAPALPAPPKPKSWLAVAQQLKNTYDLACRTS